jgi:hypothetical protein
MPSLSYKPTMIDFELRHCYIFISEGMKDREDEPCWGDVIIGDWLEEPESFFGTPIYTCQGHCNCMMMNAEYGKYIPERHKA